MSEGESIYMVSLMYFDPDKCLVCAMWITGLGNKIKGSESEIVVVDNKVLSRLNKSVLEH